MFKQHDYDRMMKKKMITALLLSITSIGTVLAQDSENKPFKHLDFGVTLGTTGIGVDVSSPVSDMVRLRAGFEMMPSFEQNMHFDVQSFDEDGKLTDSRIDKMSETLYSFTGYKVDGNVTMKGKPNMWNFKLLVDVFPFRNNKHWHVTAGFHWGSSTIATAENAIEDSPSLFSVGMYNRMYDNAWKNWNGIYEPFISIGEGSERIQMELPSEVSDRLLEYGRMAIHMGDYTHDVKDADGNVIHKAGDPYLMEPNEHSMVTAKVKVNSFKPYLGFGYEGRMLKNNDRYRIGFDCGMLFWGGTPDITTHDGTNLSKDVSGVSGKVGDYVDLIKGVKVFPVLNLKITRRLF